MASELKNLSCGEFTAALAAKLPVPGGGGAAALTGALAASLCAMAANYTVGKKKYIGVEEDVKRVLSRAQEIRSELLALIDADAEAFEPLSRAYALDKDMPERERILNEALTEAAKAPFEMALLCDETLSLLTVMLEKGSVMLVSDVGCGAVTALAALESAALNVFVNTRLFSDRAEAERIERETDALLEHGRVQERAISAAVFSRLHGGENNG